ncbi:hypothetical protein [Pseudomonas sp. EGD-AK9]|uniref:RipA family octameric membrane protein n=1 Tax=Pseudomonas sp. EGD-AK9 TaxID=1386078 RepID=UPI0012E213E4|nr:hypothetical protein [Pseudomonas sp. EGD-AK9]
MNENPDTYKESTTVELYKTAFSRLTFQDEYLFKFSTVFLTVHGAIALLARSAFSEEGSVSAPILAFASVVGLLLALIWVFWTRHNDYWHSVWTGTLRSIESELQTNARVFLADHREIARKGGRNGAFIPRGHSLALAIPLVLSIAWATALCVAIYKLCT